jgi:acetolactate synthase-1/2/3 large subunit
MMKASDLFVKALENEGVEYIFGIPGEENLDLLESLRNSKIEVIVTRHEQGAGFMAATYGRLTGKPGVCLSTLGPGATNLVTPAAFAQLGAMPLVLVTGQKPIKKSKQGRFQVINTVEMLRPVTKRADQIVDGERIPSLVREAFRLAGEERPGAVHLELPEDIAREQVDHSLFPVTQVMRPGPDADAVKQAVEMIKQAKCPLLFVGAGANRKRTSRALAAFIRKTGMPFFSTQMGVGVLDARSALSLGAAALSDQQYVHCAIRQADLIISVGHDVVEKPPFLMEPGKTNQKVIHVNFSPAENDDVYFPHHQVVGDIANSIGALTRGIKRQKHWDFSWPMKVKGHVDKKRSLVAENTSFPVMPQKLVADVRAAMPENGIVCLDNGMYKLWFVRNYPVYRPNTLLLDNALATMGAGLPSAIAAKLIHPRTKVMAVCGDGGFMMNSQELETAVRLGLNLVVVVLNDSGYGMIKWKQEEMGFGKFGLDFNNPDFVKYAESYGAHGHRVEKTEDLLPLLQRCLGEDGVHVIDVPVSYEKANAELKRDLDSLTQEIAGTTGTKLAANEVMVRCPYSRAELGKLTLASASEVEIALAKAKALFDNRDGWLPPYQRIAILEKLAGLMEERKTFLINRAISEGGKPYRDTVIEVDRAISGVKLGIQAIHDLAGKGEQIPMGLTPASKNRLAWSTWEPIGPVVSLSAFNHPVNLAVHQIIPAVAAGCPVIFKPALSTPFAPQFFVDLLHEAGLPKDWCQYIVCDNQLGEKLATDKRIGYLSFIGSARVGWMLRKKLADGVRCALEHGGSAPVIVDETADIDQAAAAILKGGFYHAGQVCVSSKRIFVDQWKLLAFLGRMQEGARKLKVGDPRDADTDVGPLIRVEEVDRMAAWVDEAVKAGAQLVCGGKKLSDTCYAPTILLNPPAHVKVSTEEIFGPIVCIYSYKNLDEAIAAANSLPVAFQSAVFTKNVDTQLYAAQRLNATAVMVNDHTAFRVDWMPFGGRDVSGLGMGGILHSAREMSREKLIVLKSDRIA